MELKKSRHKKYKIRKIKPNKRYISSSSYLHYFSFILMYIIAPIAPNTVLITTDIAPKTVDTNKITSVAINCSSAVHLLLRSYSQY